MERIDDLQCKGYRIVQDTEAFCYGIDAVLLSAFAKDSVKKESRILDLCSGNGSLGNLRTGKPGRGGRTCKALRCPKSGRRAYRNADG